MGEYHKHDMKNLEKAISKRIGGRLFHGFKKVVNSMAITNCTRELDNYLDYCEKGYRKICGYNRFADFKQFDGLTYTIEFPYLLNGVTYYSFEKLTQQFGLNSKEMSNVRDTKWFKENSMKDT